MQMFADDPDAVRRLMASQYRVAPDRLMRTGNFTGPPFPPCKLTFYSCLAFNTTYLFPVFNMTAGAGGAKAPKTSPSHFLGGIPSQSGAPRQQKPTSGSSLSRLFPEHLGVSAAVTNRLFQPFLQDFLLRGGPPTSLGGALPPPPFGLGAPSLPPDMPELDTLAITAKVKEKLATHNLGQMV